MKDGAAGGQTRLGTLAVAGKAPAAAVPRR